MSDYSPEVLAGANSGYSRNMKEAASPAKDSEELTIFVERLRHFLNLYTVYHDMLTKRYVPTVGGDIVNEPTYGSYFHPSISVMLVLYAYFYSLIEDSPDGLNAIRLWREHFPEEEAAIAAIEAQIAPLTKDLKRYRNRLGFHGSRTRAHEARGFDLFANASGTAAWNAVKNFKAVAAILLAKDMAARNSNQAELAQCSAWIVAVAERARRETADEQARTASPDPASA
jgi:hypothetical protein